MNVPGWCVLKGYIVALRGGGRGRKEGGRGREEGEGRRGWKHVASYSGFLYQILSCSFIENWKEDFT